MGILTQKTFCFSSDILVRDNNMPVVTVSPASDWSLCHVWYSQLLWTSMNSDFATLTWSMCYFSLRPWSLSRESRWTLRCPTGKTITCWKLPAPSSSHCCLRLKKSGEWDVATVLNWMFLGWNNFTFSTLSELFMLICIHVHNCVIVWALVKHLIVNVKPTENPEVRSLVDRTQYFAAVSLHLYVLSYIQVPLLAAALQLQKFQ